MLPPHNPGVLCRVELWHSFAFALFEMESTTICCTPIPLHFIKPAFSSFSRLLLYPSQSAANCPAALNHQQLEYHIQLQTCRPTGENTMHTSRGAALSRRCVSCAMPSAFRNATVSRAPICMHLAQYILTTVKRSGEILIHTSTLPIYPSPPLLTPSPNPPHASPLPHTYHHKPHNHNHHHSPALSLTPPPPTPPSPTQPTHSARPTRTAAAETTTPDISLGPPSSPHSHSPTHTRRAPRTTARPSRSPRSDSVAPPAAAS